MFAQNNNNNLNYLIYPTFASVNRLFVAYYKGNYRLIAFDLSKQTKLKDPQ